MTIFTRFESPYSSKKHSPNLANGETLEHENPAEMAGSFTSKATSKSVYLPREQQRERLEKSRLYENVASSSPTLHSHAAVVSI